MNFTPEEEEELRGLGKSPVTSPLSSALTPEEQAEIQGLGRSFTGFEGSESAVPGGELSDPA